MEKEIWKDIKGYEGIYKVSNMGRVKSLKRKVKVNCHPFKDYTTVQEKILKSKRGGLYPSVRLYKDKANKLLSVHRLVAETFIPNEKNKPQVNHIDGNKDNNKVDNLEWCNASENAHHAVENGLRLGPRGEKQGNSKLMTKDILQIRSTYEQGWFSQAELADAYSVGADHISRIVNRKVWLHI